MKETVEMVISSIYTKTENQNFRLKVESLSIRSITYFSLKIFKPVASKNDLDEPTTIIIKI